MSTDKGSKNFLTGRLLLAMPGIGDPRFHKAVIFMCAHDQNGAMGLVINSRVPGIDLSTLLLQLGINPESNIAQGPSSRPVMSGGPVESARGFVLHTSDFMQPDTVRVDDTLCVTGTIDALRAIAGGRGPRDMLFILGYAGWSAGQLDREIHDNAWLVADAGEGIVFRTDPEHMWDKAIATLGINPAMLSGAAGHA